MRRLIALALSLAMLAVPAAAQAPLVYLPNVDSVAGAAATSTGVCALIKYAGTTTGKPTVEVAAGGDMTLKIAGSADTTTGSASNGIFDLSTPAAGVDTMGELVTLINTTGSNWRAVLVSCLASDLTDNTIATLSATDASTPGGVALIRDAAVASATSVFTAQVALYPEDAGSNIAFHLSGSPVGGPRGATKINPNPLANFQTFVQHARETITSTGTVAQFEILGVKRTYDSTGKVSETVRVLHSQTGAATTVQSTINVHSGPIVTAKGELVVVRQSTGTDLTAVAIGGNGYMVRK